MKRTAEFVSLGHPDKTADYISSYILDRMIAQDPDVKHSVSNCFLQGIHCLIILSFFFGERRINSAKGITDALKNDFRISELGHNGLYCVHRHFPFF